MFPVIPQSQTPPLTQCISPHLILPHPSIFLSIPPLVIQYPSLLGLLAVVSCCWQRVGAGGTQTGAQMGSKLCRAARHTCSTHSRAHRHTERCTYTHTKPYSATSPHSPACLPGSVAVCYRDSHTQTHALFYIYMILLNDFFTFYFDLCVSRNLNGKNGKAGFLALHTFNHNTAVHVALHREKIK